ncbi:riboflavin synthase subunit beta [Sabulilitoribacter multivorans]|uniref:Riboflavin synthase subunit beta n=1 Tax=Flaviramulus multivorans TaxID=1304750 RepID=A0ABS9IKF9_9FLAO|nr:riboflavin synthase subunit beta [Flaviramulus multivorans]MCF7561057.1 riboflavin synthase subunit beta [Flaviramulus multivorans]
MGLLKLRKNKKFNYTPRYYDDKGEGNPYEIKHKFDEFRKTVGPNKGLKTKFNNALDDFKNNPDKEANRRILIIAAVLVLVFLFIIDFDLSIFFSK